MIRKKPFLILMFVLIVSSAGIGACTYGEDRGPEIANLVYFPSIAPVEEGRTETVIGTINILGLHPDTASVHAVVLDAQGKKLSDTPIAVDDASLQSSNTLAFGLDASTAAKGAYTFQVYTVDRKGRESNRLDGTLTVTDIF